jgi:glycosyltransferase involved in cell wall biosynthesis
LVQALPRVLERVPEARLLLAGREGAHTPALREAIDRLGLKEAIVVLGPRSDVPDLLCGADVFVAPSRWEGFPGAVLEAMALEAPIIASDIPTVREAVGEDDAALLVLAGDPDALADAITATLLDGSNAAERAQRARARFLERFTLEAVAAAMHSFYERALTPRRFRKR